MKSILTVVLLLLSLTMFSQKLKTDKEFKFEDKRINASEFINSNDSIYFKNKKPLYIVNGKEMTVNEVHKIKPNNIKSINVFKNKVAKRKYGKKGKYGVVEIILNKK